MLFSISQYATVFFEPSTLNQLLISGLRDSSVEVVYMAIKACVSIFTNSVLSKTVTSLLPSIQCSIELIPILSNNNSEEFVLMLLSVYNELIVSAELPKDVILSLMQLALPVTTVSTFLTYSTFKVLPVPMTSSKQQLPYWFQQFAIIRFFC